MQTTTTVYEAEAAAAITDEEQKHALRRRFYEGGSTSDGDDSEEEEEEFYYDNWLTEHDIWRTHQNGETNVNVKDPERTAFIAEIIDVFNRAVTLSLRHLDELGQEAELAPAISPRVKSKCISPGQLISGKQVIILAEQ